VSVTVAQRVRVVLIVVAVQGDGLGGHKASRVTSVLAAPPLPERLPRQALAQALRVLGDLLLLVVVATVSVTWLVLFVGEQRLGPELQMKLVSFFAE